MTRVSLAAIGLSRFNFVKTRGDPSSPASKAQYHRQTFRQLSYCFLLLTSCLHTSNVYIPHTSYLTGLFGLLQTLAVEESLDFTQSI